MKLKEDILRAYERGDNRERLDMWLMYRGLRGPFCEIESRIRRDSMLNSEKVFSFSRNIQRARKIEDRKICGSHFSPKSVFFG